MGAYAPVSASSRYDVAQVTLSAVRYANGSVDETFQFYIDGLPDIPDLPEGEGAFQNDPPETGILQEFYPFRSQIGRLCGCVQDDRRKFHAAKGLKVGSFLVLGKGELSKKLNVKAAKFSKTADEAIKAAGGSVEVIG